MVQGCEWIVRVSLMLSYYAHRTRMKPVITNECAALIVSGWFCKSDHHPNQNVGLPVSDCGRYIC